jgi:hypothetical protein
MIFHKSGSKVEMMLLKYLPKNPLKTFLMQLGREGKIKQQQQRRQQQQGDFFCARAAIFCRCPSSF